MLPPGFIQELLSRVDIVEIVGRHVELKKAGINHKGLCPFHGEKSPSFIVSPSRQTYHCFGCGVHGDAIRFLTEHSGLHFMDAVRELAQGAGLVVPENDSTPEERERAAAQRERQASLTDVLAKAGEHWRKQLKATPRAVDYLKRRGLTGAIAARFGLGYAPDSWRGLASAFARYDDPLLVESGLVILKDAESDGAGDAENEQKRYDRFRDRIMFPIRSVKGEVIGFGGRVLDRGEPKYLNSPETPVFSKGRELYGLYEARQAMRQHGYVLVVEGYMDVVALAQSNFGNAVATLGTACTADHVAKLFRFTESVVFSFDGDAAGRRAAGRALEAALPHASDTRSIRFLFLPPEHDPDTYVRELGPEAFGQAVAQAVPLSSQLLTHVAEGCDLATPEGRSKMLSQARPLFELLPDGLLREQLLAELARQGGLAVEALTAHWARQGGGAARPVRHAEPPPDDGSPPPMDEDGGWVPQREGGGRSGRFGSGGGSGGYGGGKFNRGERGSWGDRSSWRGRGDRGDAPPRRPPPQTATRLDRAAWLAARHSPLWLALPEADRDLLAGQPLPYGAFFAAVERVLHDHGAIAMAALLDDIAPEAAAVDGLPALLQRIRDFHDVGDSAPEAADEELVAVLRHLRLEAINDELKLILESGDLSPEALARTRELSQLRNDLKAAPAKT